MWIVLISEPTEILPFTTLTDWFYNIDLTLYRLVVTICTTSLTFNISKFCPHSEFMCIVWIAEQTDIFPYTKLNDWFYNIDLTLYRPVAIICTTSLILKILRSALTAIYVFCVDSEQTEIFPYTTLTDWFYNIDLTRYRPVVKICTTRLALTNSMFCPHSEFLCFLWISEQTEIFPYTTLTDWFYNIDLNPLQTSGHYMYHQFNIQHFYVLPTQWI